VTFAWHHPSHYKRLKQKQSGEFFGKKVVIDSSKDLKDQPWFKSDLFGEREKDVIQKAWNDPRIKSTQRVVEIKDITKDD